MLCKITKNHTGKEPPARLSVLIFGIAFELKYIFLDPRATAIRK